MCRYADISDTDTGIGPSLVQPLQNVPDPLETDVPWEN